MAETAQSHNSNKWKKSPVIVQAFIPISKIIESLDNYVAAGATHIQTAPVQEHCAHGYRWWITYQPTGKTEPGNSYGSYEELAQLIVRLGLI